MAKLLLESGADVNASDRFGITTLHIAADGTGNEDKIQLLLRYGAEVDALTREGKTPLQITAQNAYWCLHYKERLGNIPYLEKQARILLAAGADPHRKNNYGTSPADLWPELAKIVKEVEAEKAGNGAKP